MNLLRRPVVRYLSFGAAFVGVVAAGSFVYSNRPLGVRVATIQRDVAMRVFGLGTVEARVLSKIGFEVGATLVELKADHGDRVKEGDVAARLAVGEQEAKVAKAKAALLVSVPISADCDIVTVGTWGHVCRAAMLVWRGG